MTADRGHLKFTNFQCDGALGGSARNNPLVYHNFSFKQLSLSYIDKL